MLRYLIRSFQRNLVLNAGGNNKTQIYATQLRNLFGNQGGDYQDDYQETIDTLDNLDYFENAYIVPYDKKNEKASTNSRRFISGLKSYFSLSKEDIENIITNEAVERSYREHDLVQTLHKLFLYGVKKRSLINAPWIAAVDYSTLDKKFELLHELEPKDINHLAPFLALTTIRLQKLIYLLKSESEIIPEGNRIYYISEKLKVDPEIVSKYLSQRLFILEMPFDMFRKNLKSMIDYNVSSESLLKDLWAFRYKSTSIKARFERVKSAKKNKIMPWMVRCPEPILQRSIKIVSDQLRIFDGKPSIIEYVAERLNFDIEFTRAIMEKHPAVFRVRAVKAKEVLDYLLNEAKFTPLEIATNPRILCHSLETTKNRLEELKSMNCRPSSLVILCRSKREYEKFVNNWLDMEEKRKTKLAASSGEENAQS